MKKGLLGLLAVVLLAGCATIKPPAEGKGNVFGTVIARPHKDYIKMARARGEFDLDYGRFADDQIVYDLDYGWFPDSKIMYDDSQVNYDALDEIYVILVDPAGTAGRTHELAARKDGFYPKSLAVAKGDTIKVRNETVGPLTLYITEADTKNFWDFPVIAPGASGDLKIDMTGLLDLGADEDDSLTAAILSRQGLSARKVKSGATYEFRDMSPGTYDMMFWYWRLGTLNKTVKVEPGKSVRLDGTLSVDTIVR